MLRVRKRKKRYTGTRWSSIFRGCGNQFEIAPIFKICSRQVSVQIIARFARQREHECSNFQKQNDDIVDCNSYHRYKCRLYRRHSYYNFAQLLREFYENYILPSLHSLKNVSLSGWRCCVCRIPKATRRPPLSLISTGLFWIRLIHETDLNVRECTLPQT